MLIFRIIRNQVLNQNFHEHCRYLKVIYQYFISDEGLFRAANWIYIKWQKYSNVANRHQESKNHITCYASYKILGKVDVASALDKARKRQILRHNKNASRYWRMMKHHIDVAVYLSPQGLAFRGHSEDKFSSNRGNFLELWTC